MAAPSTASDSPPLCLGDLRARHLDLLRRWEKLGDRGKLEAAEAIRRDGSAAGAWIEDPLDRDAAQSIVDYWTAAIASLPDQPFPDLLRLQEFEAGNAATAERQAEEAFSALETREEQEAARTLFLRLLEPGDGTAPKAGEAVDSRVAEHFRRAGVIGPKPGGDGLAIVHEALLRSYWPRLDEWIAERRLEDATVDKLVKSASLWNHYGRKPVNLLAGDALSNAIPYRDRDELLGDFIAASTARERAKRRNFAITALAVLVMLVAATLASNKWGESIGNSQGFGAGKNQGFKSGKVAGEEEARKAIARNFVLEPLETAELLTTSQSFPGAEGFIWIGNPKLRLLRDYRNSNVAINPTDVRPNALYRAGANLALRSGYPDRDSYVSAPRLGALPAGSGLIALEDPQVFQRSSGAQYWLHVRQLVSVYVHYQTDTPAKVQALRRRLEEIGYRLPPEQEHSGGADKIEVRFVRPGDRALAQRLIDDILQSVQQLQPGRLRQRCVHIPNDRQQPAPGILEVWIDLRQVDVSPRRNRSAARSSDLCGKSMSQG